MVNPVQLPTARDAVPRYASSYAPCLTVTQGERFQMQSADRFSPLVRGESIDPKAAGSVVGPVAIEGIRAGDTVSIEILDIAPSTGEAYLLTSATYGILGERLERAARAVSVTRDGVELVPGAFTPYRPMIGKIGLAPPGEGEESHRYGDYGGALSNIHARPGATIYLRAHHDGGLLFLEDVHGGMGDGEATASAIEMPSVVQLRVQAVPPLPIEPPVIVTPEEVLTLGQADTLDEAAQRASEAMLSLMQRRLDIDLTQAAMVAGAAMDVRVAFLGSQPKKAYAAVSRGLMDLA